MTSMLSTNAHGERGAGLVPGEFLLTREDFRQIAAMIHADAGIHLPESKAALVYSRLAKRLRLLGVANFRDYCALVAHGGGVDERQKMLAALTTNVTRFFREPHHFEHLAKNILPPLIEGARRGGRLRLWSAGCSSGQEPYSIALTLLSLMPDAGDYNIKILATDIDPYMLAEGQRGLYTETTMSDVPASLRSQWFAPVSDGGKRNEPTPIFGAVAGLRELIVFRELNLFGIWPMKGCFQAIFCRNVAIYFEEDAQMELWSRFALKLSPGGVLYIGHSERIAGSAAHFFDAEAVTTYRLRRVGRV